MVVLATMQNIPLKIGNLYRTPQYYSLTLYPVPIPFRNDNIPPYWRPNIKYWGSDYGVDGYLPMIEPGTIFTLFGSRAIKDNKRGMIHLFHVLTLAGQIGFVFLAVPRDCKEVTNVVSAPR